MIIPGVQKPHCTAPSRTKALWMGCRLLGTGQALDREHRGAAEARRLEDAGAPRFAVDDDGAGAALALPAAILGSHKPELLAKEAKEAKGGIDLALHGAAVHLEGEQDLLHAISIRRLRNAARSNYRSGATA